jgi:hypothetical protein
MKTQDGSAGTNVRRFRAFASFALVELDRFSFAEGLEAVSKDIGVMDEQIAAPIIVGDESEAFGFVEPFDGSGGCHVAIPFFPQGTSFQVEAE